MEMPSSAAGWNRILELRHLGRSLKIQGGSPIKKPWNKPISMAYSPNLPSGKRLQKAI